MSDHALDHSQRDSYAARNHGDVDELEAARISRLRASHDMTMSERLARAHALCAQLSRLRPIEPRSR